MVRGAFVGMAAATLWSSSALAAPDGPEDDAAPTSAPVTSSAPSSANAAKNDEAPLEFNDYWSNAPSR